MGFLFPAPLPFCPGLPWCHRWAHRTPLCTPTHATKKCKAADHSGIKGVQLWDTSHEVPRTKQPAMHHGLLSHPWYRLSLLPSLSPSAPHSCSHRLLTHQPCLLPPPSDHPSWNAWKLCSSCKQLLRTMEWSRMAIGWLERCHCWGWVGWVDYGPWGYCLSLAGRREEGEGEVSNTLSPTWHRAQGTGASKYHRGSFVCCFGNTCHHAFGKSHRMYIERTTQRVKPNWNHRL